MAITRGSNQASAFADFADAAHPLAYSGASGRLQVACAIMLDAARSFTTPTAANVTFTLVASATTNGITVGLWAGVATGAVGTVTFGTSGSTGAGARVWCREFLSSTGWTSPIGPFDTDVEASTSTAHPALAAQLQIVTVGGGQILVVGLTGLDRGATSLTTPAGYTAWAALDAGVDMLADRIDAAPATRNFSSTSGAPAMSAMVLASFAEDSAGGGGVALTLDPAAMALAGSAVTLRASRLVGTAAAAVTLTGQPLGLRHGRRVELDAAAVTLAVQAVTLPTGRRLALDPASVALDLSPLDVSVGRRLALTAAAVTLTAADVALTYTPRQAYALALEPCTLVVTLDDLTLDYSGLVVSVITIRASYTPTIALQASYAPTTTLRGSNVKPLVLTGSTHG